MSAIGGCLIGVLLTAFALQANPFDEVVVAIRGGNANGLSRYFGNMVAINIAGKSDDYSKSQAEVILRDFFARNAVKSFELIHQGESSGGSRFGIGNLVTSTGNYRTYFFLKQNSGTYLLQEIRFETR